MVWALLLAGMLAGGVPQLIIRGLQGTWAGPPLAAPRSAEPSYRIVHVQQGDTLWSLAQAHGGQGLGIQERIAVLQNLNDLEGSFLRVGMVLKVPATVPAVPVVAPNKVPATVSATAP